MSVSSSLEDYSYEDTCCDAVSADERLFTEICHDLDKLVSKAECKSAVSLTLQEIAELIREKNQEKIILALRHWSCPSLNAHFQSKTLLTVAAHHGLEKIVLLILKCGAHPNLTCLEHYKLKSALHIAARFGHARICLLLFCYGANIEYRDASGASPVCDAVLSKCVDTFTFFLHHGANWDNVYDSQSLSAFISDTKNCPDPRISQMMSSILTDWQITILESVLNEISKTLRLDLKQEVFPLHLIDLASSQDSITYTFPSPESSISLSSVPLFFGLAVSFPGEKKVASSFPYFSKVKEVLLNDEKQDRVHSAVNLVTVFRNLSPAAQLNSLTLVLDTNISDIRHSKFAVLAYRVA